MEFFGYLASLVMGVTLGIMGAGGSILTVPILVYIFGITPSLATGYSLFIVGVTALIGAFTYVRKGHVDFHSSLIFALPSILGVLASRTIIVPILPDEIARVGAFVLTKDVLIMSALSFLMIAAATGMLRRNTRRASPASSLRVASQGLSVGVVAGFVGAGGGFLIVPALVLLVGIPMHAAVGTSLLIIALQSLIGFGGDLIVNPEVHWPLLLSIGALAAGGIFIGSRMIGQIQEAKLKRAFGWFVLLAGSLIFVEQLANLS